MSGSREPLRRRVDLSGCAAVEAHAAAIMRERALNKATLYINNTPCPGKIGCDTMLPHMLPEGALLDVFIQLTPGKWSHRQYEGLPDSMWNWPPWNGD